MTLRIEAARESDGSVGIAVVVDENLPGSESGITLADLFQALDGAKTDSHLTKRLKANPQSTDCAGCDGCCRFAIWLSEIDAKQLADRHKVDLMDFLEDCCEPKLDWEYPGVILEGTSGSLFCRYFNEADGLCRVYDCRPLVCRLFYCAPVELQTKRLLDRIKRVGTGHLANRMTGQIDNDSPFQGTKNYGEVRLAAFCTDSEWDELKKWPRSPAAKGSREQTEEG